MQNETDWQFDLPEGRALREEGIALASESKAYNLNYARVVAIKIAASSPDRSCTADQVQRVLIGRGIHLGNATGGIFKGKQWRWSGKITTSARTSNHARILRVWELAQDESRKVG